MYAHASAVEIGVPGVAPSHLSWKYELGKCHHSQIIVCMRKTEPGFGAMAQFDKACKTNCKYQAPKLATNGQLELEPKGYGIYVYMCIYIYIYI